MIMHTRVVVSAVNVSSDRVLRPMILTKQLDLQSHGDYGYVSPTTPRTNLAKELEKYNRAVQPDAQNPVSAVVSQLNKPPVLIKPKDNAPERPNILSKRPHYKPQYRYDPQAPINLSTKNGINLVLNEKSEDAAGGVETMAMETLDLSMKKPENGITGASLTDATATAQPPPLLLVTDTALKPADVQPVDFSNTASNSTVMTVVEPMDFSTANAVVENQTVDLTNISNGDVTENTVYLNNATTVPSSSPQPPSGTATAILSTPTQRYGNHPQVLTDLQRVMDRLGLRFHSTLK